MRMMILVQRLWLAALVGLVLARPAEAYIGPGAGLGTVLVAVALGLGLLLVLAGFVWYPLKRMMRKRKASDAEDATE